MWIHLLTTRLIDGASEVNATPAPAPVGGGYSEDVRRKRRYVEIDGVIYEGDYEEVKARLAALAKKRAIRAAKKAAPKGAAEPKKPEALPEFKVVGFELPVIQSIYIDAYFQSYADSLIEFRRRQDEEEVELLLL